MYFSDEKSMNEDDFRAFLDEIYLLSCVNHALYLQAEGGMMILRPFPTHLCY